MLYSIWATNYIYIYDNPMMMNSAMFSSVQETLQSRRGRKRWKRDFWEPEGWGDHRGKRYFKGSVRGCELLRKRLNPQLWSRLLALCVRAGGISALSLKLPCQHSFRGSFWSCCDSSTSIPCMRGYTRYLVNVVPDIFWCLVKSFMETNMILYLR